ncbi:MAG: hypothetical protein MZV70_37785 [Desulfobacterales bacterium]|nr:hypothetical protein [Desulfobacterales bacterium]
MDPTSRPTGDQRPARARDVNVFGKGRHLFPRLSEVHPLYRRPGTRPEVHFTQKFYSTLASVLDPAGRFPGLPRRQKQQELVFVSGTDRRHAPHRPGLQFSEAHLQPAALLRSAGQCRFRTRRRGQPALSSTNCLQKMAPVVLSEAQRLGIRLPEDRFQDCRFPQHPDRRSAGIRHRRREPGPAEAEHRQDRQRVSQHRKELRPDQVLRALQPAGDPRPSSPTR